MRISTTRNILFSIIVVLLFVGAASAEPTYQTPPYKVTVNPEERAKIHSGLEAVQDLLIDTMLTGATYDSISYGGALSESIYPFAVANTTNNRNERNRKTAKLSWAVDWAKNLGLERVVQRQPWNYVYAEIGDADAPEMIMAFSHLDSPTASINANNSARWVDKDGNLDPMAYIKPYIKDGWIYGCGIQDDSGPTLATLISLKVINDANLPFDRRIRVVMGGYEDSSPTRPSVANTLNYIDIPYPYTSTTFYDGWAYKYLNREEIPIAGYSADSRFPMNLGTRREIGSPFFYDLSADTNKPFRLISADMHVSTRPNEPTIIDIIGASGTHIPSQGRIKISLSGVNTAVATAFKNAIQAEITAKGWGQQDRIILEDIGSDFMLTANSWRPVDAVTPQYGSNGVVMAMHLATKGFDAISATYPDVNNLEFRKMAKSIDDMFMPNGVENYLGLAMGLYERDPYSGVPLLSISFGQLNAAASNLTTHAKWYNPQPLYPVSGNNEYDDRPIMTPAGFSAFMEGKFFIRIYAGTMCQTQEIYDSTRAKLLDAFLSRGWALITNTEVGQANFTYFDSGNISTAAPSFGNGPPMHMANENIAVRLLLSSYWNSAQAPTGMDQPAELLNISYPTGSTGGNYSSDYWNKMIIFGAIIPGNERWFHTANERMTVNSAIQTGKFCADAMVELARYMGPAGAQMMWADIPGYNADRADIDLLDVVLDTYVDASGSIPNSALDDNVLAAATAFDIPMFRIRWNTSATSTQILAGDGPNGIYLSLADLGSDDFVLPMRLEFKLTKEGLGADDDSWEALRDSSLTELLSYIKFGIMRGSSPVALTLPNNIAAENVFYKRVSARDPDSLYISINIALADTNADAAPRTIVADSKTDLFKLNPAYVAANGNPWPERGKVTERGFFLFGDGAKDARFTSDGIFLTIDPTVLTDEEEECLWFDGCNVGFGIFVFLAIGGLMSVIRKKV